MAARIKQIKKGKIDADRFSTKRDIELDLEELETTMRACKPRTLNVTVPVICTPPVVKAPIDDGKLPAKAILSDVTVDKKDVNLKEPIKGDGDELIWPPDAIVPPIIQQLYDLIRTLFNIKDEVRAFTSMVWMPRAITKGSQPKIHVVPSAPLGVSMRAIVTLGSKEMYKMQAGAGGRSGDGTMLSFANKAFMIDMGVASALRMSFDDGTSALQEARKGHRAMRVSKDPSKCWVIVVDGLVNTAKLMQQIKAEADKLSNGNTAMSEKLQKKVTEGLGVVDAVAALAAADEAVPELTPLESKEVQPGVEAALSTLPPMTGMELNTFHQTSQANAKAMADLAALKEVKDLPPLHETSALSSSSAAATTSFDALHQSLLRDVENAVPLTAKQLKEKKKKRDAKVRARAKVKAATPVGEVETTGAKSAPVPPYQVGPNYGQILPEGLPRLASDLPTDAKVELGHSVIVETLSKETTPLDSIRVDKMNIDAVTAHEQEKKTKDVYALLGICGPTLVQSSVLPNYMHDRTLPHQKDLVLPIHALSVSTLADFDGDEMP